MLYLTLFPNLIRFNYSTKKAKCKAAEKRKAPCIKMKGISIIRVGFRSHIHQNFAKTVPEQLFLVRFVYDCVSFSID